MLFTSHDTKACISSLMNWLIPLAPWILMYKQDVLANNPDIQTFIRSDNETASINLMNPALVNLFSNLNQLVNLKDYTTGKCSICDNTTFTDCYIFRPANGCSTCRSLVKIIFFTPKELFPSFQHLGVNQHLKVTTKRW